MKVLVVSDTHGYNGNMLKAIEREKPFDLLVHCGDLSMDIEELMAYVDCPVYACAGNNDFFYNLKQEEQFYISDKKALLTHGHRQGVSYDLTKLLYKAEECDAEIVFFGHTHVPFIDEIEGITFINPGSLTYPRQERHIETYVVMNIDTDGNIDADIKYVC